MYVEMSFEGSITKLGQTLIRLLPFCLLLFRLRWFAYYDVSPTASSPTKLDKVSNDSMQIDVVGKCRHFAHDGLPTT